jgi:hypothetical protein
MRKPKASWPRPAARYTAAELRLFEDREFDLLVWLLRRRLMKYSPGTHHANEVVRRLKKLRKGKRKRPKTRESGIEAPAKPRPSEILDGVHPNRAKNWKSARRQKKTTIVDLVNFSFIDHPVATIEKLRTIAEAECFASSLRIDFSDHDVLDIGPYLVLGQMLKDMIPIVIGGKISTLAQQAFDAVGLNELLEMRFTTRTHHVTDVWPFRIQLKEPNTQTDPNLPRSPARQEKVAENFADTINEWLGQLDEPLELTEAAKGNVIRLVGEALNNAERHSRVGSDGHWAMTALMSRRTAGASGHVPGAATFICRVSIFSLGYTISETISAAEDASTRDDMANYREKHLRAGFSGPGELLNSVFALQDGVSCTSQVKDLGGVGMMDMATFTADLCQDAGGGGSEMVIVSGNTYVAFRDKFAQGVPMGPSKRRFQWFNGNQDWELPPDPAYVMALPHRIPGTVISIRFGIGPDMLQES